MSEEQAQYTMSVELVKMFRQVVPEMAGGMRSFTEVNEVAIKRGYLVVPEACTGTVMDWLEDERCDPNATFFKDWAYVKENDKLTLMFEQLLHYLSTYGTDFSAGNGYVSNDGKDKPLMSYDKLTVVTATTADKMKARCVDMLKSGIALGGDTVKALVDFVVATGGCPAAEIPNREAAALLHFHQGTHPGDPVEFVRYLVFLYTGTTLLIKNKTLIEAIRDHGALRGYETVANMSAADIDSLATVFYRFKPLLLAMKGSHSAFHFSNPVLCNKASRVINRIRVRADKLKRPMEKGILERICEPGDAATLGKIESALRGVTMFRKLRLLQCVIFRKYTNGGERPMYRIRNGKLFIRDGYRPKYDPLWMQSVTGLIVHSLAESLKAQGKTFRAKLPDNCDLAVPMSEKNFLGDYPMGTFVRLAENNIVGVYWRNEWGTRDFDLSLTDMDGRGVSWHSTFRDGDYMHSGDMTNADPEASECIYFRAGGTEGGAAKTKMLVKLNQYSGDDPHSRYRFFIAKHDGSPDLDFSRGYMVDPKDIVLTFDSRIPSKATAVVAVCGNYALLLGSGTGRKTVTFHHDRSTQSVISAVADGFAHIIRLRSLLTLVGYEIVPSDYDGEVDLDLTDIKRDTLIKFFTEVKKKNGEENG